MSLATGSQGSFTFSGGFTVNKSLGSGFNTSPIGANFPGLNQALSLGSGANQFNMIYAGTRSVANGTPDLMDLTSLSAPDGTALALADVCGLLIRNQSGSAGNLAIGAAGSNAWSACLGATGTITLPPGGMVMIFNLAASGYTVDSTHKILELASSAGTCSADVMVFGH